MNVSAFPLALSLLLVATAVRGGEFREPSDTMPIPGNRLPSLEQRLRSLEERLKTLEGSRDRNPAAIAPAPEQSYHLKAGLDRAEALLKKGEVAAAAAAYRETLRESLAQFTPKVQSLTDVFIVSCTLALASETLLDMAELELTTALNSDALSALRRCRDAKPEWNANIMEYVLKKVEQRAAELK